MAATAWPAPVGTAVPSISSETQIQAIVLGASIPTLLACAAWWLHLEWLAAIAALGILIGPVLAVVEAPRMLAGSGGEGVLRAALAAPVAASALILGGVFVWWVVTVAATSAPIGFDALVGIPMFGLLVVFVALVVGVPVTLPTALVVAFLLRRADGMGRNARPHLAALAVVAAVVGIVTLLAASGSLAGIAPDLGPIDIG